MGSFKSCGKILSGLYFSGMKMTGLQVTIKVIFSCMQCFNLFFFRLAAYQYSVLNQFEHDPDDEMGDHDQVSCFYHDPYHERSQIMKITNQMTRKNII
jgi:hypothetical protein